MLSKMGLKSGLVKVKPGYKSLCGGCPTTHRMPAFVILSEAKNLMNLCTYYLEILRLTPQNDVVGQPLRGDFAASLTVVNPSTSP